MSETSIRKIRIPLTTSGKKLQKKSTTQVIQDSNVLYDFARYLQKKYKILSTWKGELTDLFELCKTRSESKCVVELFSQSKKAVRKAKKTAMIETTTKTSKSLNSTSRIFKQVKQRRGSSKKAAPATTKQEKDDEVTITENAQRSK